MVSYYRMCQNMITSERKKWEFRYETQDRRMKDMMELISELKKTVRELKSEIKNSAK